jgi:hypothetical protein
MLTLRSTPPLARLAQLAALALCAAVLAACGASSKDDGPGAGSKKAYEGALKFAKCMRQHGVNMPDPKQQSGGEVAIAIGPGPGGGEATDRKLDMPKMKAAEKACSTFLAEGAGPPPSPAEQAKMRDRMLRFAKCMRDHGIDMPDPKFSGDGGVRMTMRAGDGGASAGSGPDPRKPRFQAAEKQCRKFLGDGPGGPAAPAMSTSDAP